MRIVVTGSRKLFDKDLVQKNLDWSTQWGEALGLDVRSFTLLHGAAQGADMVADAIARDWGWAIDAYPAKWKRRDGTVDLQAGRARNIKMLKDGKPDVCLAFWEGRVGRSGTLHMMSICVQAGIPTTMIGFQTWLDRKRG